VFVYPIKSCKGISVKAARVTKTGFKFDRQWMVVDQEKMRFISQRNHPKLARVNVELPPNACTIAPGEEGAEAAMVVSAPELMERPIYIPLQRKLGSVVGQARVWEWTGDVVDEGDGAAEWFSELLGAKCRLVRFSGFRNTEEAYAPDNETAFADGFPFLVTSKESLEAVNAQSGIDFPMNRFRPNVVVEKCGGAFDEDYWSAIEVKRGHSAQGSSSSDPACCFTLVKPCSRCKVTTVNQATGTVDGKEPLQSLTAIHSGSKAGFTNKRTFANVPLFGWNAICGPDMLGRIVHSGSSVEVTERRQSLSDFT